jgi:hypothetical protein
MLQDLLSMDGFDIDFNIYLDNLANALDEDLGDWIPDFEFLKVHIPGFDLKYLKFLSPSVTEVDIWSMFGFGPHSLIPVNEWWADAAGYLLRPDVLGSALVQDIFTILFPGIGIPLTVLDIYYKFKDFAQLQWNDFVDQYNSIRSQIMLCLHTAHESLGDILSVLQVTIDVRIKMGKLLEFLPLEMLREWADQVGLSDIQQVKDLFDAAEDIDAFLNKLDSKLADILDPYLSKLDLALSEALEAIEDLIEYIDATWPLIQKVPDELFSWIPDIRWGSFPGSADAFGHKWYENLIIFSLFGLAGIFFAWVDYMNQTSTPIFNWNFDFLEEYLDAQEAQDPQWQEFRMYRQRLPYLDEIPPIELIDRRSIRSKSEEELGPSGSQAPADGEQSYDNPVEEGRRVL